MQSWRASAGGSAVLAGIVPTPAVALLRLDRIAEATEPLTAGGVPIHLVKPDWARFSLPDIKAAE